MQLSKDEAFWGTVVLQSWHTDLAGHDTKGYTGWITIWMSDDVIPGKNLEAKDANYGALVKGETSEIIVPGCQIHAIVKHPEGEASGSQFWKVW